MGMSATQARYLNLVAQQSDLEFQGQQINESRTTLSEQTNNLYTQLQNMDVPTPPMTGDFTTLVYSATDNAVTWTVGSVRPSTKQSGMYSIDMSYTTTGGNLTQALRGDTVEIAEPQLTVTEASATSIQKVPNGKLDVENQDPDFYVQIQDEDGNDAGVKGSELKGANISDYVVKDGAGYKRAEGSFQDNVTYYPIVTLQDFEKAEAAYQLGCQGVKEQEEEQIVPNTYNAAELADYYVQVGDKVPVQLNPNSEYVEKVGEGYQINLPEGAQLYKLDADGAIEIENPVGEDSRLIGGNTVYTYAEAQAATKGKNGESLVNWKDYEDALKHRFGKEAKMEDYLFTVSYSKTGAIDVTIYDPNDMPSTSAANGMEAIKGYNFVNASYTTEENHDPCDIRFDASGRIISIDVPVYNADRSKITGYKTLEVTSKSVTDEKAYADAMSKYEHAKYKYDQDQTAINAQMSIIQAEDKKLELKLTRLDNERTQITTEMEALKKVIADNIEFSYKTFSG